MRVSFPTWNFAGVFVFAYKKSNPFVSLSTKEASLTSCCLAIIVLSSFRVYPFQNRIQVSNRGGSIFLICDQSDLEAGFHFGTGIDNAFAYFPLSKLIFRFV